MASVMLPSLIAELEGAVKGGSSERRVQMLRQVTDLFLSDHERFSEQQIAVFDDVMVRLIDRVEARTLEQLSTTLADLNKAPKDVVRQLAFHEEAVVAAPVLTRSGQISDNDLLEIASTRGQQHLLAISQRKTLNEVLTDVLLKRGDTDVTLALAGNIGARFSEFGYNSILARAGRNDEIAEKLGSRLEIPFAILKELLRRATEAVRLRLLKNASPENREKIQVAIQDIADEFETYVPESVDYTESQSTVLALNRAGKLNDSTVNRFAVQGDYNDVIAAVSLLSTVAIDAIEPLLYNDRPDGLIVACRAARLSWSTTLMILRNRPGPFAGLTFDLDQSKQAFDALSLAAAQRTMRFWSARSSARKPDGATAQNGMVA